MEIPQNIEKEISDYILEHGACGEVEYVSEIDGKVEEQKSDLSFCDVEYVRQTLNGVSPNVDRNVAYCAMFFPYSKGYLKVPYAL